MNFSKSPLIVRKCFKTLNRISVKSVLNTSLRLPYIELFSSNSTSTTRITYIFTLTMRKLTTFSSPFQDIDTKVLSVQLGLLEFHSSKRGLCDALGLCMCARACVCLCKLWKSSKMKTRVTQYSAWYYIVSALPYLNIGHF